MRLKNTVSLVFLSDCFFTRDHITDRKRNESYLARKNYYCYVYQANFLRRIIINIIIFYYFNKNTESISIVVSKIALTTKKKKNQFFQEHVPLVML